MRRFALPVGRRLLVALLILAALLLFLPLRLALSLVDLSGTGIAARHVSGTIWSGRLEQVTAGHVALGTLDTGLNPLPLLLGRARIDFARTDGGGEPLAGAVEVGRHRFAVADLTGSTVGGALDSIPIERVTFDGFAATFTDDQCRSAAGRVRLTLAVRIAGLDLRNGLSGEARCDGADLLLPLVGDSGLERVTMRFTGDGQWRADIGVAASDPMVAAALAAAGFAGTAEGYRLQLRGRL